MGGGGGGGDGTLLCALAKSLIVYIYVHVHAWYIYSQLIFVSLYHMSDIDNVHAVHVYIHVLQVIIPSLMPSEANYPKPNDILSDIKMDVDSFYQPPMRRFWLADYIPEGFWPRLICRIATDHQIGKVRYVYSSFFLYNNNVISMICRSAHHVETHCNVPKSRFKCVVFMSITAHKSVASTFKCIGCVRVECTLRNASHLCVRKHLLEHASMCRNTFCICHPYMQMCFSIGHPSITVRA